MKRNLDIRQLQEQEFDLAIIGGGITGAGILSEASKRGYNCVLLEKNDFASGTSSKSAKLIHGGMRYLRYGKFDLVKESLEERNYLLTNFPHLVKPLPFLFPVYNSKYKYKIGMAIYQYLNHRNNLPDYQSLNKKETLDKLPTINTEGLKGSFIYYDAVTNDARLCNEIICTTTQQFGAIALNYCELLSQKAGSPLKLNCQDHIGNQVFTLKSKYIVNASGVWTDEVANRLTKSNVKVSAPSTGVHIVLSLDRFPIESAVVISSYANDERMLYAIPWENNSCIIGTTDTDYSGNLENPTIKSEDIKYLIHALQHFAPSLKIIKNDILYAYIGIRPLLKEDSPKSSSSRSRDYQIWWKGKKIMNIFGGKLTSFHSMANSLLDEFETKHSLTPNKRLPNLSKPIDKALPVTFIRKMDERYGKQSDLILQLVIEHSAYLDIVHKELDIHVAELVYFIKYQSCYHLDDLMSRRLSLTYVIASLPNYKDIIKSIANVMKWECYWSKEIYNKEINNYISNIEMYK